MKKLLTLILITLSCLLVCSCKRNLKIALMVYSNADDTVNEIVEEIERNLNPNYELQIFYADNSQAKQNEQFLNLINSNIDIFLVNLVDRLVAKTFVEKCKKKNIPIIFFNREPLEDDLVYYNKAYYVGNNGEKIGLDQASIVREMFWNPDSLNYYYDINNNNIIELVILKGEQGHQITETIFEKCIDELHLMTFKTDVIATEYANWDREVAKEKITKLYNNPKYKNPDGTSKIELVISNDDRMSMGIIDFINENNLWLEKDGKKIMPFDIVGANMTPDSYEAIKNGYIYASITSANRLQAQIIIDLLEYLANGKKMIFSFQECSALDTQDSENYCSKSGKFIYVSGDVIYSRDNQTN